MSFERPEFLVAVPALWLLLCLLSRVGHRPPSSRFRRVASLLARGTLLSLLAVAAAGPHRSYTLTENRPTAHLLDRSASVSPPGREESDRTGLGLSAAGPTRPMPFGGEVDSDPRPPLLRATVADPGRVILQTDGHLSPGGEELISDLATAGRTVGVLPLESEEGEVAGSPPPAPRIDVPHDLEEGEPFAAKVSAPGAAAVTLTVDGTRIGRAAATGGRAVFPDLKLTAGAHLIVAVAESDEGRAASSREVRVEGQLRVLVIGGAKGHPFARGLAAQGISVEFAGGGRLPDRPDGVRVVVALPGFSPADAGPGLISFVNGGGGLFLASGAPPGLAGLSNEPIAEILPATARPPAPEPAPPPEEPPPPTPEEPPEGARPAEVEKDAATLTLVLVIDRSGSMRGEKIGLARAACYLAAQALDPVDRFGVLAFNHEVEWVHPIGDRTDLEIFRRELLELKAAGGTEIFLALKTAADAVLRQDTAVRHIILVSDGQDVLTGFRKLLEELRAERISVSTVGVGEDFEVNLLGSIAQWGAGEFYPALDPRRLPQVVTQDTRRVVETAKPPPAPEESDPVDPTAGALTPEAAPPEEDPAQPPPTAPVEIRAAAPLPFLEGLDFPELSEVEPTDARFPAQVALETATGMPALTFWRYGKGRVALLTADPGAWSRWDDLPRFAAQTVRMLAGESATGDAPRPALEIDGREIRVEAAGGDPTVTVDVDGTEREVPLRRTGPDSYVGSIADAGGSEAVVTARGAGGGAVRVATILPLPPEALATGIDRGRIDRLAAPTTRPAGTVPPFPGPEKKPGRDPLHLPFLIAALVLLPVDVGVRRIGR